jgi:NAD(P)-dependent dehydrogenase (short-subunit alcohol dehydrogenase family)
MTDRMDRKAALVIGGASAIGRASCRAFARAGAAVILVDRDGAGGARTAKLIEEESGSVEFIETDITECGAMNSLVGDVAARYGEIDFLHCSDVLPGECGPITSLELTAFDETVVRNVKTAFLALRYVLPVMVRQSHGTAVISCTIAALNGIADSSIDVASNHALLGLMRAAALDVAARGVRVNAVCQETSGSEDVRSPQPAEIADMVLFLCSALAKNITGAHFIIDGGQSASLSNVRAASRPAEVPL